MPIISLIANTVGQLDVHPRLVKMITTDNLATITTAGYLNKNNTAGNTIVRTDILEVCYSYNTTTKSGTIIELIPTFSAAGVITLSAQTQANEVTYTGTPVVNRLAHFASATGVISSDSANVDNAGNISAGSSTDSTAGVFTSYPSDVAKGGFRFKGIANTGDTITTFQNEQMGQTTTITCPDPASANANVCMASTSTSAGAVATFVNIKGKLAADTTKFRAQTSSGAGGSATVTITDAVITTAHIVDVQVRVSANAVSIQKITPNNGSITVLLSADPGAYTLGYIAVIQQ